MTSEYSGCVAERTEIETGVFGPEDLDCIACEP